MKKGIIISDTHCGHQAGLTPPEYQYKRIPKAKDQAVKRRSHFALLQKEMWNWYEEEIKKIRPLDFLFSVGDLVDGPGKKSGGTEQISADENVQVEMAIRVLELCRAKRNNIVMTYGTPYHTGTECDYEDQVASALNAKIGSHEWVDINGLIFDLKHKVGRSGIPHGKGTAISKEWLTGELWALMDMAPRSGVYVRAHVHYPFYVGDPSIPYLAMITPGMQWSTKFGSRQAVGTVAAGFIYFEISDKGEYTWQYKIAKLPSQKVQALKL